MRKSKDNWRHGLQNNLVASGTRRFAGGSAVYCRRQSRNPETFGFRVIAKVDNLARFPEMGRIVPEENDDTLREIVLRPYRIIYRIIPSQQVVAVARIWHGARGEPDIPSRLTF
jgi:toxin ParE1/3/4